MKLPKQRCNHLSHYIPVSVKTGTGSYDPGVCASCGIMIDIRTGLLMTPSQISAWAAELLDARVDTISTAIYASEVSK